MRMREGQLSLAYMNQIIMNIKYVIIVVIIILLLLFMSDFEKKIQI